MEVMEFCWLLRQGAEAVVVVVVGGEVVVEEAVVAVVRAMSLIFEPLRCRVSII
jgi:hypothetical protein